MYIFLAVLLFVFICIALYSSVKEKNYVIYSDKIKKDVKIALLSDLHSRFHGKNQSKLLEHISKANPDFIALAGDIFDGRRKDDGAICLIENLPKNKPCFYVTGNHEHKSGKWKQYYEILSKNHITVLDEKKFYDNESNISFNGVSDPNRSVFDDPEYRLSDAIEKITLKTEEFNILLVHTPFYVEEYKKRDFDLILSGHTHGGQVRIPFILNGLFNRGFKKRFGFFPPYCGGLYTHGKLVNIVSRGLSNNPAWVPRVFNRREFVNVIIKQK